MRGDGEGARVAVGRTRDRSGEGRSCVCSLPDRRGKDGRRPQRPAASRAGRASPRLIALRSCWQPRPRAPCSPKHASSLWRTCGRTGLRPLSGVALSQLAPAVCEIGKRMRSAGSGRDLIGKIRKWVGDREEALTTLTRQTAYNVPNWPCGPEPRAEAPKAVSARDDGASADRVPAQGQHSHLPTERTPVGNVDGHLGLDGHLDRAGGQADPSQRGAP
jgi:hypothetical protein